MTLILRSSSFTALAQSLSRHRVLLSTLSAAILIGAFQQLALAQNPAPELSPAVGRETASRLVRWTGSLPDSAGKTVEMHFAIYENAAGGLAVWSESQSVTISADGRYSVLLGANTTDGLPQTLFPSGEPRWVEAIPVANLYKQETREESESSGSQRRLLAAVPYAFKSVDAESLAGRAASDYVTHEDLKSFVPAVVLPASPVTGLSGVQPNIAGTGTTNALALWTNSTTLGNSVMSQSGTKIGINTTTPSATLDVHGNSTLRGTVYLPPAGTATASSGYNSAIFEMATSVYSSTAGEPVNANFAWQNTVYGNNTGSAAGTLDLLYATGANNLAQTGLSFAPNGKINFAAGQTFPGTGTITGITTTSPLSGSGTSGSVALSLNLTTLETTLNSKYAQLGTANNFTSSGTWAGPITGNSGSTMYAIQGNTSTGSGVQGYATGTSGWGVNGYSTGNGGIGVYGNATGNVNGTTYPIGVYGHVVSGTAIKGTLDAALIGQTAVLGQTNGASAQYTSFLADGLVAGVWGDASNSTVAVPMAVAGTADNGYAGVFENTSTSWSTLYVYNKGGGSTGVSASATPAETTNHFSAMMVGGKDGTCGVSTAGSFSCTGPVKSLVSTGTGERMVETYSVQSPENWMEDFGAGALRNGSVVVTIDPAFSETVSSSADYHVFLTPRGDSKGLYVTHPTATTFEVHESGKGSSSIGFDYRIVAKRRGFEALRLTDVTESVKKEMAQTRGTRRGFNPVGGIKP